MDDILLVEPAEAVSENVKEAIKLRTDPLSATRLVTTPAQIKEKINAKMSADGRYLYNDQFSEVTVCDANGNNLVNNEYYSFIARDKDKLFMAKNNADTDVLEFSIPDKKFVEEVKEEMPSEQVIAQEIPSQEVQQVVEPVQENTAEADMPYEFNFVYENEDEDDLGEEISIPVEENNVADNFSFNEITSETPQEEVDKGEEVVEDIKNDSDESEIERRLSELNDKFVNMNSYISQYEPKSEEVTTPEDRFSDSEVQIDSIDKYADEDEFASDYSDVDDNIISEENTTYSDAANVIRSLMQNNSEQKEELNRTNEELNITKEELDKVKASRKALSEKYKSQTRAMEAANDEIRDLKATVSKTEAERDSFEGKYHDLRRVSDLQKRELEKEKLENQKLRMKLASKDADRDELDQLVRDARALVNENNYYNEDSYSYRRVA